MLKQTAGAILGLLTLSSQNNFAATVAVAVTQDAAMHELFPDSNFGRATHLPVGAIRDQFDLPHFPRARGLLRFDLAGKIPAGATVTAARLKFSVLAPNSVTYPAGTGSDFELHRVLRSWGEGAKTGNTGAPASPGESAWLWPAAPNPGWAAGGASAATDAVEESSSVVAVDGVARYTFPSSATMVADVQGWIANPGSNFGWLMKSASEAVSQTARRVASKETPASAAVLEIDYATEASPARIVEFRRTAEGMFLAWTGGNPPYRVQRAESILGPWEFVTVAGAGMQATAPFGATTSFYRVASEVP